MGVACGTYEGEEKCTPTLMEKPKERNHLDDLLVDGMLH
jgi:hypothetical protein